MKIPHTLIGAILLGWLVSCSPSTPSVSLSATPNQLEEGQPLRLKASVAAGQAIAKVEFYQEKNAPALTIKLGEVSSAPYELEVKASILDETTDQNFSAKVWTQGGQVITSTPVSVKVQPDRTPPEVTLSTSSNSLNSAGNVMLSASASDNIGVVKVEFFKGSEKLGQDSTPADGFSLMVSVGAQDNGAATYSTKAYDARGNVGSAEASISVDIDATAPKIALYTNKTKVTTPGSVALTAVASDNKAVTKVEFYLIQGNAELQKLAEDTEAPFTYQQSFDATQNGNYIYTARAYDTQGNSTSPGQLSIAVDIDSTKPSISLTTNLAAVNQAGPVLLSATAHDDKGVSRVEFYAQSTGGTSKLGEDTQAPYTYELNFTAADNGTHTYTAIAYDPNNNSQDSDPVSVTVNILGLLVVSISGLPDGTSGLVNIAGPDGFRQTLTASTTLNNLKPGTYFLTPSNVDEGDFSYGAAASRVVVSDGNTANATITYAALNGALTVNISGLPSGQEVYVTGPNEFFRNISATTTFQKLEPGSYTVSAGHVVGYVESIEGSPATVEVGQRAVASVNYAVFEWTNLVDGGWHTCGIGSDGKAYCWGANNNGQLGNGSNTTSYTPQAVSLPPGVTSFSQLAAGEFHTCGIGSDGKAYCWGRNTYGGLGNGSHTNSNTPVAVILPSGVMSFSHLVAGWENTCGIGSDGKAFCWGWNYKGQLGNGTLTDSNTPVAVILPSGVMSFSQLVVGGRHACGVGSDGNVYCWGATEIHWEYEAYWFIPYFTTPQAVNLPSGLSAISGLAAGYEHTCGIGSDGNAYCWGNDSVDQLGNGTSGGSMTPQGVSLPAGVMGFSQLAAGSQHTCGIGSDGKAYCWGYNFSGQLGNGNHTNSNTPQAVILPSGVTGFSQLVGGESHTCGIGSDGNAYCWGYNWHGQLGNGNNTDSSIPVLVRAP